MTIAYKEDIESMLVPDAAFIKFQSRCHPDSDLTATYSVENSSVVVACGNCGFGVVSFPLASRPKGTPALSLVPNLPTSSHVQDQRQKAKRNRKRVK
jgi:hypothetical protein